MLTKENFSKEHIRALQAESKKDPGLIERALYAFGLLQAITQVGLPFIFKGGTCLMLLLEHPMRLSTDIDIIVEPGINIEGYIEKAALVFPFLHKDEQVRIGKNQIEKRHFKFTYQSPITGKEIYILLDVLFEHNHYARLITKEIKNELLLTDGEPCAVRLPNINCILGDKLTAFAPHTIGIPINAGKNMEVMKQMYDVCTLLDAFDDFAEVQDTYSKVAAEELAYRGNQHTREDALNDTIQAAICIASRGKVNPSEYPIYVSAIRDLRSHIYAENYSPEIAAVRATKVLYMAACLLTQHPYERVMNTEECSCIRTAWK